MGINKKRIIRSSFCLLGLLVIFGLFLSVPVSAETTASVRWGYGTTSHTADDFLKYDVITEWIDGYYTDNSPALNITGLKPNTTYYYRVQIKNGDIITTSLNEESFTTFTEEIIIIPTTTVSPPSKGGEIAEGGSVILGSKSLVGGSSGATSITDIFPMLLLVLAFGLMIKIVGNGGKGGLLLVVIAFILIVFAIVGVQIVQQVVGGL
jgi:hypothetical protein